MRLWTRLIVGNPIAPGNGAISRRRGALFALVVALGAAPAWAGPPAADATASTCWSPGGAPALFAWTDTPAIACRNSAEAARSTAPAAAMPPQAMAQAPAETGAESRITISGEAYFGVAVSF